MIKNYEQSCTGCMDLGVINPVDEGIVCLVITFIFLGAIGGGSVLQEDSLIPFLKWWQVIYYFVITFSIVFFAMSLYEILKVRSIKIFLKDMALLLIFTVVCLLGYFLDSK